MRLSVRFSVVGLGLMVVLAGCKGEEPPVATSIATNVSALTFASLNESQSLTSAVVDQRGDTMPGQVITYSTNNALVASVAANGVVTSVANGTAIITVASGATLTQNVPVTVAQVPAQLTKTGDAQTATQGTAVTNPLIMNVKDAGGAAVAGVTVTFAVTSGGGSVAPTSAITNAAGNAQTTWTMGPTPGAQTATATVVSLTPVNFSATSVAPGAPATIVAFAGGTAQTSLVGFQTNIRPAVRVLDGGGQPLAGVTVTFAVTGGGGSLTNGTVLTNANGVAQVGSWTVGPAPAANTLDASVAGAGITGNPMTFTANAQIGQYNIVIQNIGPAFSPAVQAAFDAATAFWQNAIFGDQSDVPINSPAGQCAPGQPAINQTVDDLLILARFDSIDGPSQVLGSAGPCLVRTSNRLTIMGSMRFDTADVAGLIANNTLNAVIRHEMGHVLGFGTLFGPPGNTILTCTQNPSSAGNVMDTYFNCARALSAFDSIGGSSYTGGQKVPLENCGPTSPAGCGSGTFNSHWREPTFFNELMTGYLNSSAPSNPASILTIAAMEDIGYLVNYAAAEAYSRVFSSPSLLRTADLSTLVDLSRDGLAIPIYHVDANGRITGVSMPR